MGYPWLGIAVLLVIMSSCGNGLPQTESTEAAVKTVDSSVIEDAKYEPDKGSERARPKFGSYEDASIFLRGLIGAEADDYGNMVIYRDSNWGQRAKFRLGDVMLTKKVVKEPDDYYGGVVGPRVVIRVECKKGPCITDPGGGTIPALESKSFFVEDIEKGNKVYETLLVMQQMLQD